MKKNSFLIAVLISTLYIACQQASKETPPLSETTSATVVPAITDTATFAGGCFWCIEASFEQIKGVVSAVSGYAGGDAQSADYKQVSSGTTRHAEAVQVIYDPSVISYDVLLDIFFTAHDPTQLNRQGLDVGPQYRSEIFYHSTSQRDAAKTKVEILNPTFGNDIVTKISKLEKFYEAEDYHQDFERKNPTYGYIVSVSKPKIDKVKKAFYDRVKDSYKD